MSSEALNSCSVALGAMPLARESTPEAIIVPPTCVGCAEELPVVDPLTCDVNLPPNSGCVVSADASSNSDSTTPLPERLYGALNSGVTCDSCAATALSFLACSGGP